MRKIEIKDVKVMSAFKTTIYVTLVPLGFMMAIGLLVTIISILFGNFSLLAIGIPYIIMPIIFLGLYGVFSMLIALVYNKLSSKFGGLEVTISEKNDIPHNNISGHSNGQQMY